MIYANENQYEGEWYFGSLLKGKMDYSNGDRFDGEWRGNQHHGEGTFTYVIGTKVHGQFEKGEPSDTCEVQLSNGNRKKV